MTMSLPHRSTAGIALAIALALGSPLTAARAQDATVATGPAAAPVASDSTLLSVTARGQASRAPDVAGLSAGVVTQAADANAAMRDNAARMARLMEAIRAAGVAARDVQTSGISLHPMYRHVENENPAITGYSANNTVNLKVRDLAKLGDVLDALVASGANNLHGPSFEIDQPEAAYDEARRDALEQARARARMYAESLGLRVRRIVSVSEGGGFQPPQPMYAVRAMAAQDSMASTPVAPGENTLEANLQVVFELGR